MSVRQRTNRRELYYARDNTPSYNQFGDQYHFMDSDGRQYQLATQNGAVFQNRRFPQPQQRQEAARCVVNTFGYVTLYVRLKTGVAWFSPLDLDRPLIVRDRDGEDVGIRLRQLVKVSPKKRTGTVLVSGLSASYCNALLNQALNK
jgi:hypothetical protein